jgi:hypothetical protein
MGALFLYEEVEEELRALQHLAKDYVDQHASPHVLDRWINQLRTLRAQGRDNAALVWEIPRRSPLRTIESRGTAEQETEWPRAIGTLSMVWEIRHRESIRGRRKHGFEIVGLAAVHVDIAFMQNDERPIGNAKWNFDVGVHDNPGFHTHAQVDWRGTANIEIPRLPSLIFTPMDTIDFLLGELFPKTWPRHVTTKRSEAPIGTFQARRFGRVSKWWATVCSQPLSTWQSQRPNDQWLLPG